MPDEAREQPGRRRMARLAAQIKAMTAGGGMLDRRAVHSRWLHLTRPTVALPGLPAAWDGLRIAHLSDLHVGPICGLEYLRRVVAASNAAAPDLVVLTGDHVSHWHAVTPDIVELLTALRAPEGKFAVLGNHDYHSGWRRVAEVLEAAGIVLLNNAHRLLRRGAAALCIAGVDDHRHGRPDARAALAGVDPAITRVVLCHNPDYVVQVPAGLRADLFLCGHTHGGQIRLPFGPPIVTSTCHRRFAEGLVRNGHGWVYTSRGTGMAHLPFRLNCRPELPLITLRRP